MCLDSGLSSSEREGWLCACMRSGVRDSRMRDAECGSVSCLDGSASGVGAICSPHTKRDMVRSEVSVGQGTISRMRDTGVGSVNH